jgi:hypothetical protein
MAQRRQKKRINRLKHRDLTSQLQLQADASFGELNYGIFN